MNDAYEIVGYSLLGLIAAGLLYLAFRRPRQKSGRTGAPSSESSPSSETRASALFALTTSRKELNTAFNACRLSSVDGLDRDKAVEELMFLRLSAVDLVLFGMGRVNERPESVIAGIYKKFLALFWMSLNPLGPEREEHFLQMAESRGKAYYEAHNLWYAAHKQGRGQEQTFVIGETFFRFCGVQCYNPIILFIGGQFNELVTTLLE